MEEDGVEGVRRPLNLNSDVHNDMGGNLDVDNDIGGIDSDFCLNEEDNFGVDDNDVFVDVEDDLDVDEDEEDECVVTGFTERGNVPGGEDVGENASNVPDGEVVGENAAGVAGESTGTTGNNSGVKVVDAPSVGMVFSSWDEVNNYYKSYGKQEGFGVVCVGGRKPLKNVQSKSVRNYVWKCECYGTTRYRRVVNGKRIAVMDDPLVKKKSKKCNCPVMMYASMNESGEWVVKKVDNKHQNHTPAPGNSKHIAMYKKEKITKMVELRIDNDYGAGSSIPQIYNNLAHQRNGYENMGFSKKDMYNIVNRKTRLKLRYGDAMAMLEYFHKMTEDNQNFFHMHRLDEAGRLKDVMWVDARSRVAYEYFSDVVCFDSTYMTNKYHMPFSNFVGVNHHGQSVLLGCALVSHEDAETFVWLFKTWLSCMGGKPPAAIMTDQDQAMRKAIAEVFPMPCTYHRWCMWHIMQKFAHKLGSLSKYQEIKEVLKHVIYNSLAPEEFVDSWMGVMDKYHLKGKECYSWLEGLFEEREMWIPAYLKHVFWAGMQTTQRVESMNSFFDGYVRKSTRLFQFAPRYCKAMESRAKDEQEADANSSRFVRPLMTEFALERTFQKVYTDAKFQEVQVQCTKVMYLTPQCKRNLSDSVVEHVLEDRVWIWSKFLKREIPIGNEKRNVVVTFDMETSFVECDCKHFECHGIVCSHIVKVLDMQMVTEVPDKYLLDRWRKDIHRKHTMVKVAYHDPSKTEEVQRYDKVMLAFEPVVLRASVSDDSVAILMEQIRVMVLRLDEMEGKTVGSASVVGNHNYNSDDTQQHNQFPPTPSSVNKGVDVGGCYTHNPHTPMCSPNGSPTPTPTPSPSPTPTPAVTPFTCPNCQCNRPVKDPVSRARKKTPQNQKKKPAIKKKRQSKGKEKGKKKAATSSDESSSESGKDNDKGRGRSVKASNIALRPPNMHLAHAGGTQPIAQHSMVSGQQNQQFFVGPHGQPILANGFPQMSFPFVGGGCQNFIPVREQPWGEFSQSASSGNNLIPLPAINYSSVGGIQLSNTATLQYFTNNFQR